MSGTEKVIEDKAKSAAPERAAAPKTSKIEQAISRGVETWINENLRNTPFSRDTTAWNILQKALPKLPGAIAKEVE